NVRGWHGYGGVEAIDMGALFQGVPNDPGTSAVAFVSPLNGWPEMARHRSYEAIGEALPQASIEVLDSDNATVNRKGYWRSTNDSTTGGQLIGFQGSQETQGTPTGEPSASDFYLEGGDENQEYDYDYNYPYNGSSAYGHDYGGYGDNG